MGISIVPCVAPICLLVTGCGIVTRETVVVTATPKPTPYHVSARSRSQRSSHATPTAVAQGSAGISLTYLSVNPSSVSVGGSVTLTYTLSNGTGSSQSLFLGATIYSDSYAGNEWSDPGHDAVVTVGPGTGTYQRQFSMFPEASGGQTYDVLVSVADASAQHLYDEHRYTGALTVLGGTSSDASTPAPSGSSGTTLLDTTGNGAGQTQEFTTPSSEWTFGYAFDCGDSQGAFGAILHTPDGGTAGLLANELNTSDRGASYQHQGGTFYVEINSTCSWHIVVTG